MHHGRSPRAAERVNRLQHAAAMLHCVRDTGTGNYALDLMCSA
jgi:hypothetical protein